MSANCQGRPPNPLRILRLVRGLRQSDIAVAAGVDLAIVSRLERGIPVSRKAQDRISEALGVDLQAFLGTPKEKKR